MFSFERGRPKQVVEFWGETQNFDVGFWGKRRIFM